MLKGHFQPVGSPILPELRTPGRVRKEPEASHRSGLPRGDTVGDTLSGSLYRDREAGLPERLERFCDDSDLAPPRRSGSKGSM